MQNKMKKTKKGFTLVELMVVLAILGILAAIAIPKYNQVKAQAAVEADINTANTIIHAARMKVLLDDLGEPQAIGGADDATTATLKIDGDDDVTLLKYLESLPTVQSGSENYTIAVADNDTKFTVTFKSKHKINTSGKIDNTNGKVNVTVTEGGKITVN